MRSPERACHWKAQYDSKRAARTARRSIQTSEHLSIYRCPFCGYYHLGHKPKAVRSGEITREEWT